MTASAPGQAWLADALTKVAAATHVDDAPDQIRRLGGQLLNSGSESGHILLRDV